MNFDNQFNNGGGGQWLDQCPGEELRVTPQFLREIGATSMAEFVEELFIIAGDAISEPNEELRLHNLGRLPDSFHDSVEDLSGRFQELEPQFLESLYSFTLRNWQDVQTA
jgi:hypothetical protein